jgi:SAM-dependent methyltransferase
MAEAGYQVKGVDLSESAIRQARDNARSRGLEEIEFVVGDMREKRPETYDLIVNLFTSFGYFEEDSENARIIGNVSEMLRPQGVLVIDYFNSDKVRNQYQPYETGQIDDISYEIFRYIEQGAIFKEIKFNGRTLNEKSSYQERVKLYDLEWFEETLNDYQLSLENVHGDYDGSWYVSGESPRMIILARK